MVRRNGKQTGDIKRAEAQKPAPVDAPPQP